MKWNSKTCNICIAFYSHFYHCGWSQAGEAKRGVKKELNPFKANTAKFYQLNSPPSTPPSKRCDEQDNRKGGLNYKPM